jgi:lactate dehydrogenase-like 2-hydroxyacid dehydrogenase
MNIAFVGSYIFFRSSTYEVLKKHFDEVAHIDCAPTPENLTSNAAGFDVLVTYGRITKEVASNLEGVKLIVLMSAGHEELVTGEVRDILSTRGIRLSYTPAYASIAVSEFALAISLALNRRLVESIGKSLNQIGSLKVVQGRDLSASCCGIVGLGSIGSRLANSLMSLGVRDVVVHTRSPLKKRDVASSLKFVDIEDLCRTCDTIFIACSSNSDTRFLFGDAVCSVLKSDVTIINVARPDIFDPKAIAAFLISNPNAKVACDGDIVKDSFWDQLTSLPNFIATPHIAFNSLQALQLCTDVATQNAVSFCVHGRDFNEI